MISVDLDKIVTAKGLQSHLSSILFDVEEKEKTYIITKQGKPQAAIVNVDYLLELTGQTKLPEMPEFKPTTQEEDAPLAADRELDKLAPDEFVGSAAETPLEGSPMNPDTPISPPEPAAPVEPPPPPPATITDLEQFAATDAAPQDADPYAVIDEPAPAPPAEPVQAPAQPIEQQYDQNGLPVPVVPGQPDPTEVL